MPIRPFLNSEQFDQETLRVLGVAFEQVCIAVQTGDCEDDVKQAIANKVIELAKTGERNPDLFMRARFERHSPTASVGRTCSLRSRAWRANARPRSARRNAPRTDPNWSRAYCNSVRRDGRVGWASRSPHH